MPNAALRFRPTTDIFAALNQAVPPGVQFGGGRGNAAGGRGWQGQAVAGFTVGPVGPGQVQAVRRRAAAFADDAGVPGAGFARGAAGESAPTARGGGEGGRGAGGGGRGGFGGGDPAERQARMLERFKTMSPDEQKQFLARMKERGQDTSEFEKALATPKPGEKRRRGGKPGGKPAGGKRRRTPCEAEVRHVQNAQTIDALFAPLPPVESRGRAWLFIDHQLKPVNLRLGITDGTNTEVLSGELQPNMEVVTGVTGLGTTRTQPQNNANGNPLMPGSGAGGPRRIRRRPGPVADG